MTDRITAADPLPQREVDALVLDGADTVLLEEIMTVTPRSSTRWLPVLAAAAAVAVIGAGAMAVGGDTDSGPQPSSPGFAEDPSSTADPTQPECDEDWVAGAPVSPPASPPVTAEEGGDEELYVCVVPRAGDDTLVLEPGECEGECAETTAPGSGDQSGRYQAPLRPFLITADGWEIDAVDGYGIDWRGPDGELLHTDWVVTADPDDPFAYDRWDRPGEAVEVLGLTTRVTGFGSGQDDYQVALTAQVPEQRYDDGAGIVFETKDLDHTEFRAVIDSARFVPLEEFEDAAGR